MGTKGAKKGISKMTRGYAVEQCLNEINGIESRIVLPMDMNKEKKRIIQKVWDRAIVYARRNK